ncbi:MAG TPA: hypothetical protein VH234_03590 [Candidatus Saccharimonadales bacterium]|jgi:hypothetical protein|nr:hypothetical protein [Candidatus Saccharimonadales bacterium]
MLITKYKKITALFALISLAYVLLVALLPQDKATLSKYHISGGQLVGLDIAILAPYIVIWLFALVGYLRLKAYAESIRGGKDGEAFRLIALGLFWLSFWLPISAVISSATSGYYRAHTSSTPEMINLNNYVNILLLLAAFIFVYEGSKKLLSIVKRTEVPLPHFVMILFISFSSVYTFLVIHDPARQFPTQSVHVASYYLPDWLIILSIVIPRLITWYLGVKAIHNIYMYRKKTKAPIYKHALSRLAFGLGWVIATIIVLRLFESLTSQLNRMSLQAILLIIYVLLAIMCVGYVLIAKGARSLQRIEEI